MPKATRIVDVTNNGITTQTTFIVDKNDQDEEAISRSLVQDGELVNATNPLRVSFPATQPVSLATLPVLPAGSNAIGSVTVSNFPSSQAVSGTVSVGNFPATQTVSFGALPAGTNAIGSITNTVFAATQSGSWNLTNITGTITLPTGAATAAKQPNFGVAGTPSTEVLSFQGVAGGIALSVVDEPILHFANYATATRVGASVLKSSPGRLIAIDADGTGLTTAIYLQIYAATAIPAASDRCFKYFPVLPGTYLILGRKDIAIDVPTGIVVAASTTRDTYTAVAVGDLANVYFTVSYR